MRHDTIEVTLAQARSRGSRIDGGAARAAVPTKVALSAPHAAVIDEAIAGFETRPRSIEKSLLANLAAQLDALDLQRAQLVELLRNIDSASAAS